MPVPALNKTEQVKLGATFLNTLAAGLVTVGIFTPLALLLTTPAPIADAKLQLLIAMAVVCIIAALVLHFAGQALLRVLLRNTDDE